MASRLSKADCSMGFSYSCTGSSSSGMLYFSSAGFLEAIEAYLETAPELSEHIFVTAV